MAALSFQPGKVVGLSWVPLSKALTWLGWLTRRWGLQEEGGFSEVTLWGEHASRGEEDADVVYATLKNGTTGRATREGQRIFRLGARWNGPGTLEDECRGGVGRKRVCCSEHSTQPRRVVYELRNNSSEVRDEFRVTSARCFPSHHLPVPCSVHQRAAAKMFRYMTQVK